MRSAAPMLRCAPQLRRRAVLRRNRLRHRPAVPRQPQARMRCAALQPRHGMCVNGALSCACGAAARGRATTRRRRTSRASVAAIRTSRSTRRALSVRQRTAPQMSELMTYTCPQTTNPSTAAMHVCARSGPELLRGSRRVFCAWKRSTFSETNDAAVCVATTEARRAPN